MVIRAAVVGATGYTGQALVDILLRHPDMRIAGLYSTTDEPKIYADLFPRFKTRIPLCVEKFDIRKVARSFDLVFLALPHTQAMKVVPALLKSGTRVVDLSADYRLKDSRVFERWYAVKHSDTGRLKQAVYGLPELFRQKVKTAQLVANPGCYPTAAILGLAPLVTVEGRSESIIIDAKSGTSGAGKKAEQQLLFSEVSADFKAYKVNQHQHMPEIEQQLSRLAGKKVSITFVPHLLPLKVGILETIYVTLAGQTKRQTKELVSLYAKFYQHEPFVRICEPGRFPQLKDVVGTNFCDIGVRAEGNRVIIVAAIDNLIKGASGQAVQNANIMFGFPESTALL